jgi:muconate cycloisomerase
VKIRAVETHPVQLPPRRPHGWAGSIASVGGFVIVKLHTDEGLVGLGEAATGIEWGGDWGRYAGESAKTVCHVLADYLLPAIAGESPFDIELIHARMDRVVRGHHYAKAALDMACYDLMGKATGKPAHAFLGGCFRREIRLVHSLGLQLTPDQLVAEAEAVLQEGIKTLKLKVGGEARRDLEATRRLRELAGPDIEITLDANRGWRDVKTAVEMIKRLEAYRVSFIEQPVEGADRLAAVRRQVSTPLMADESAWTPQDVYELAQKQAVDMISVYTTKPGGLHKARKVATVCEVVGFSANLNGSLETGVGNAANLHLVAACRAIDQPCVVATNAPAGRAPTRVATHFYTDDIVAEPYVYRDGHLVVPDGPGLGIELDEAKLRQYRIG